LSPSGRAAAKSSASQLPSKPAHPRAKSPVRAAKSPPGPGRPRCPHGQVEEERTYDGGVVVAFCADECGSKLKRCPDCGIWENYK